MKRAAKVDKNQPTIVKALRRIGAKVLHCHQIKNAFDILVAYQGKLFMIEIKDGMPKKYDHMSKQEKRAYLESKLSPGEKQCMEDFQSAGVTYHIVATIEEAISVITE